MICAARLSRSMPSRVNTCTSMTVPEMPDGTRKDCVLHVGGLLAEDRAQQLLFRRQLGFALRRHLADQHVTGLDFGADVDDARLVETAELRFAEARDVARDFLGTELGVARDHRELLDVDRRVAIVADHALGDQDRVFVVVAVPRHERDEHVLAERQLAHVGRRAVGDDVALGDDVADLHQRTLVDVGVLVAARVLGQVVDVDADFAGRRLGVVHAHDHPVGVDVVDLAAAASEHRGARIDRCGALHAGARPAASRRAGTEPPGAACSSPSARGWRRRARGTGSAMPPPTRSAPAPRP